MTELKKLDIDLDFLDKKEKESIKPKQESIEEKRDEGLPHQHSKIVRPWIRYWARYTDILLFSTALAFFFAIFFPSVLDLPEISFGILSMFIWVFFEAAILSRWGTTPWKWLLSVNLKGVNNGKLEYTKALRRSFFVWVEGLGLGIPFVTFFTLINSYNKLEKNGITSWDKEGDFTVTHGKIRKGRVATVVIIFILFIFLTVTGSNS